MTTVRIARFYGVSQELVMRRFLEVGYVDWISDEADRLAAQDLPWFKGYDYLCKGPSAEAAKVLRFCIDAMAIRPPDPPPKILTGKKLGEKLERERQKKDAFDKLPPEEKFKVLQRREKHEAGTPQGLLKRIVERLVLEDKLPGVDSLMGDLTGEGVTDLILNAIRTQNDRRKGSKHPDPSAQDSIVRYGTRAVRVFRQCKTGQLVDSWGVGKVIR